MICGYIRSLLTWSDFLCFVYASCYSYIYQVSPKKCSLVSCVPFLLMNIFLGDTLYIVHWFVLNPISMFLWILKFIWYWLRAWLLSKSQILNLVFLASVRKCCVWFWSWIVLEINDQTNTTDWGRWRKWQPVCIIGFGH